MKTDPARKAWLASLKPGDLVMVMDRGDRYPCLVQKVFKTRICYRMNSPWEPSQSVSRATGTDAYCGDIFPPTSAETIEWKRQQVINSIRSTAWSDVSLPTLRRVAALLESPLGKRSKPVSKRGAK